MGDKPKLAIGLPVHNGERFLEVTVRALLDQTYRDFDLIICDNASTDSTADICRHLAESDSRIRVIRHQTNVGATENFNAAFRAASATYFKWAADDDLHHPDHLAVCIAALEQNPNAVLAYTRAESITADGTVLRPDWGDRPDLADSSATVRFVAALAPPRDPIPLPMFAVIRADALSGSGLLRPMPEFDRALIAELSLHGPFVEVPDVHFGHREHDDRMGPALSSDSRGAGQMLGGASHLPHWRLLGRHLGSIRRRPATVAAGPLVAAVMQWAWRWRIALAADIASAAVKPLAKVPTIDRLIKRLADQRQQETWNRQQRSLAAVVDNTLRPGDQLILVDGDTLTVDLKRWATSPLQPADSADGSFPATSGAAVQRLNEAVSAGYTHLAIAWPVFWILDYHQEFADHLNKNHRLVAKTDEVSLYRLTEPSPT